MEKGQLDELYSKYSFALDQIEIDEIAEKISDEDELEEKILNHISKKMSNNDFAYHVMDEYIKKHTLYTSTGKMHIDYANMTDMLEAFNYKVEFETIAKLLSENIPFKTNIEYLFTKYKNRIINGDLDTLFTNDTSRSIMECYCVLNNVEIKEIENYDDDPQNESTSATNAYLREIKNIPLLTQTQEKELAEKIRNGDREAIDKFVYHNLKLVVSIAKKYIKNIESGMEFLDLIQEGNIGLTKAVTKFNPDRGIKFSSFAVWQIRADILSSIREKTKAIRLPANTFDKYKEYAKKEEELRIKLGRKPTIKELAKELNTTENKVRTYLINKTDVQSYNVPITEENNEDELVDFIADDNNEIEENAFNNDLRKNLMIILMKYLKKERDIKVVLLLNGFINNKIYPMPDIAHEFNMTHQNIHNIFNRALIKLRNSAVAKQLYDYYGEKIDISDNYQTLLAEAKCDDRLECEKTYNEQDIKKLNRIIEECKQIAKRLDEYQEIKKEERAKLKKVTERKSIYEYFQEEDRDIVTKLLESLPEEDRKLAEKKFDGSILTKEEKSRFNAMMQGMRVKLEKEKSKLERISEIPEELYECYNTYSRDVVKEVYNSLTDDEKNIIVIGIKNPKSIGSVKKNSYNLAIEKLYKILSNYPTIEQSLIIEANNVLTPQDTDKLLMIYEKEPVSGYSYDDEVILAMKLGRINGKRFSNKVIAEFLKKTEEEIEDRYNQLINGEVIPKQKIKSQQ